MKNLFFKYKDVVKIKDLKSLSRPIYGDSRQGYDVWHYHNFSSLYSNGFPVTGVLKFYFPLSNKSTLDKGSLHKYLKPYSFVSWGAKSSIINRICTSIKQDISFCLSGDVEVFFHEYNKNLQIPEPIDLNRWYLPGTGSSYPLLDDACDSNTLGKVIHTDPDSDIVECKHDHRRTLKIMTSSLQHSSISDDETCFADLFIEVDGNLTVNLNSLLRYVVSFRYKKYSQEDLIDSMFSYLTEKFGADLIGINLATSYNRLGNISICSERYIGECTPVFTSALPNVRIVTNNMLR